jgi:hypothetical protein
LSIKFKTGGFNKTNKKGEELLRQENNTSPFALRVFNAARLFLFGSGFGFCGGFFWGFLVAGFVVNFGGSGVFNNGRYALFGGLSVRVTFARCDNFPVGGFKVKAILPFLVLVQCEFCGHEILLAFDIII